MNRQQAKQILQLYRPGVGQADPEVAAALALAQADPKLGQWFEARQAWHAAMRQQMRALPVPPDLAAKILERKERKNEIVRPVFRPPSTSIWLAAAAALVLLLGLAGLWLRPQPAVRFADYRARLVRTVLREYRLDVPSNDPAAVRRYMAERGGPADYALTPGLERLELAGGGFLRWRNEPVSMICFYRPDKQMVYLFVMDRSAVKDAPPPVPVKEKVKKLLTASWTRGNRVYMLAGPEEPDFYQKYLGNQ